MNLILIGPQGCGKGTQADKILEKFKLEHIEVGGLIRDKAHQHDKKAEIIDHLANQKGVLLPDGIVLDMLIDHLDEVGYQNLLFDGFPRTVQQLEALKEILADEHTLIDAAIYIHISDDEALKRLEKRGREDDHPDQIKQRLQSYHQTTQPVVDQLKDLHLLLEINGEQEVDQVFSDIQAALEAKGIK